MVKKLSEMAEPLRRGRCGNGDEDDDEDRKRGALVGDWASHHRFFSPHHINDLLLIFLSFRMGIPSQFNLLRFQHKKNMKSGK